MKAHTLFAVAPFVSILLMAVGAALRVVYDTSIRVPPPASSAAVNGAGTNLLATIGVLGVLLGHLVMVVWPDQLLIWNRSLIRLIVFEVALVALGAAALGGAVAAVRRRVLQRTANRASLVDAAFLGTWLVTLSSGLAIAIVYRWATVWSAVTVTPYARSLLSLQPDVARLETMPYLVRLHIFSSFIVVALLAFTRMLDFLLSAAARAIGAVAGPLVSTVDRQWRPLQERALRSGRTLIWPEEDD